MCKKIEDGPERNREPRPEEQKFRVAGGALLVWKPAHHGNRDVPCVTVGSFKSGVPCVNFRKHHVRSPFVLSPSQEGISLSFMELDGITERLRALANVMVSGEADADVAA